MSGSKRKQNREKWQVHMESWERSDTPDGILFKERNKVNCNLFPDSLN